MHWKQSKYGFYPQTREQSAIWKYEIDKALFRCFSFQKFTLLKIWSHLTVVLRYFQKYSKTVKKKIEKDVRG